MKLGALAKKYHEKKAKKSGSLSVGDTPTLTPGSLERYERSSCNLKRSRVECALQCLLDNMDNSAINA